MRTLSSALNTEVAKTVTSPGYLVEIMFAMPVRLSSRGTLTWNGLNWQAADFRVSGLAWDAAGEQTGRLDLGNTDLTYSSLVLAEGVAERAIRIWKFYGAAPGASDTVQIFNGVGDEAEIMHRHVSIGLTTEASGTALSPREFIGQASGFNWVPASGTIIPWAGENYRLERD